ncbi:MAG: hypothetical protein ACP5I4_11200 [Oceanipulchritudo sp.]
MRAPWGMMNPQAAEDCLLFEIPVRRILDYLERMTGMPFPDGPEATREANKWHLALRRGLRAHLHLNVGIPGIEEPAHPIEENACALHAALLLEIPSIKVALSGEWEVALAQGLITDDQYRSHRQALRRLEEEE